MKSELESHADLEEKYLFPVLRKQPQTKDLVASALNDNRELRRKLEEVGNELVEQYEKILERGQTKKSSRGGSKRKRAA